MDEISQRQRQHVIHFSKQGPAKITAKRDKGARKLKATVNIISANEKSDELRLRRYDWVGAPFVDLAFKNTTVMAKKYPNKRRKYQAAPE